MKYLLEDRRVWEPALWRSMRYRTTLNHSKSITLRSESIASRAWGQAVSLTAYRLINWTWSYLFAPLKGSEAVPKTFAGSFFLTYLGGLSFITTNESFEVSYSSLSNFFGPIHRALQCICHQNMLLNQVNGLTKTACTSKITLARNATLAGCVMVWSHRGMYAS